STVCLSTFLEGSVNVLPWRVVLFSLIPCGCWMSLSRRLIQCCVKRC
ncbi:thiamine ABC transporter, ATP-binding protein, partial [Vibrio parahaemolyticus V-223/04]